MLAAACNGLCGTISSPMPGAALHFRKTTNREDKALARCNPRKRRLDNLDRGRQYLFAFSICTLNINSLGAHFEDMKTDKILTDIPLYAFKRPG